MTIDEIRDDIIAACREAQAKGVSEPHCIAAAMLRGELTEEEAYFVLRAIAPESSLALA